MSALLAWTFSHLPALAGGIATLLAAVLAAWGKGRRDGRLEAQAAARARADRDSLDTIRRIENAKDLAHSGGAAWLERLRRTDR